MSSFHTRRGSAAVEFFIWLPILMFLLSAVVDWGYYMSTKVGVARAAMDGARIAAATFEPSTSTAGSLILPRAKARTLEVLTQTGIVCAGATCTIDAQYCTSGANGPCDDADGNAPPVDALLVSVRYDFTPFFGFAVTPAVIYDEFVMATENQR